MATDEDLLLKFQNGSHVALEELFARYRMLLYTFFARRLPARHRADDLVQDTFVALIKGSSHYEPLSSVRAYLFGIAFRILFAERRRSNQAESALAGSATAEQFDQFHDRALWVREALFKLEETDREVLMLREYEQLSYSEIATLLRLPVNTVRSRLFRSRVAMKQLLEPVPEHATEEGDR